MATLQDIISRAAVKIASQQISGFSEDSVDAAVWATNWKGCLDRCLDSTPWHFATKTVELSRLSQAPTHPAWPYQFQLPTDIHSIRRILNSAGTELGEGYWTTESDKVLARSDRLFLSYGRDYVEADIPSLPSWFVSLFVATLASDGVESLTGMGSTYQRMQGEATIALKNARVADGRSAPAQRWGSPSTWRAGRWSA